MTRQSDYTLSTDLAEKGRDAVPELLRVLINQAMQAERAPFLNAGEYERTEGLAFFSGINGSRIAHCSPFRSIGHTPSACMAYSNHF